MCKSKMGIMWAGIITVVFGALALADFYHLIFPETGIPWIPWFVVIAGLFLLAKSCMIGMHGGNCGCGNGKMYEAKAAKKR